MSLSPFLFLQKHRWKSTCEEQKLHPQNTHAKAGTKERLEPDRTNSKKPDWPRVYPVMTKTHRKTSHVVPRPSPTFLYLEVATVLIIFLPSIRGPHTKRCSRRIYALLAWATKKPECPSHGVFSCSAASKPRHYFAMSLCGRESRTYHSVRLWLCVAGMQVTKLERRGYHRVHRLCWLCGWL